MKKLQTFLNGVALTSKKEKAEALSKYIAKEFRVALTVHRAIRWLKLDDGKQPTDLSGEQLKTRFMV